MKILIITGSLKPKKLGKVEEKIIKKTPRGVEVEFLHLRAINMPRKEMEKIFKRIIADAIILKNCHDSFMIRVSNILETDIERRNKPVIIPVLNMGECCEVIKILKEA